MDTRKFTPSQKERFLKLASNEFGLIKPSNEELWEEIQKIKVKLGDNDDGEENKIGQDLKSLLLDSSAEEESNEESRGQLKGEETTYLRKSSDITYATYKNLPSFLRRLSANDYTKFLTHPFDITDISRLKTLLNCEAYNFDLHLKKIKEVFDVLTIKDSIYKESFPELNSYFLPRGIFTKIKQYIYGTTWSLERNIKMHWSHEDIQKWTVDNPGKAPSPKEESLGYEGFYFYSPSFNENMSFSDLIIFFKNEIHIRSSNSLYGLINDIYNNPDNSFNTSINIENNVPDNINFYTDVEKLRLALKLILELIIECHSLEKKPKVLFNVSTEDEITLSILHLGNTFEQNIKTLRYGKSFGNLITLLNGVCELDLFAKFSDSKSYHLKIWEFGDILRGNIIYRDGKILDLKEKLKPHREDINGVQYNLTFNKGL